MAGEIPKCLQQRYYSTLAVIKESTPLNKLAVVDAAWARMPVDSLNMTLNEEL